jgi:hypothetical protein
LRQKTLRPRAASCFALHNPRNFGLSLVNEPCSRYLARCGGIGAQIGLDACGDFPRVDHIIAAELQHRLAGKREHTMKRRTGSRPAEQDHASGAGRDFSFIPEELATKCDRLIRTYHAAPGSPHLADLVWHSDARAFIGRHQVLDEILTRSAKARSAKRTDYLLRIIAKTILAVEVLASDFAGWGTRFPYAMWQAEKIQNEVDFTSRGRLMDHYLYQPLDLLRDLARVLDPS